MSSKLFLLFLFIFNFHLSFSQNSSLNVLTIPDSLKKDANSVVRFYDTDIELVSQRKMIIKVSKAITILNKHGDSKSRIIIHYDKNRRIKSLKAIAYDSFGEQLKKFPKSEFDDYAISDGFSLFNDGRVKYYRYVPLSYPYTIYYEYEIETPNTAFIPRWYPIDSYDQSVEKSSYTLSYPSGYTIQKVEKNFGNFNIEKSTDNLNTSFNIKNAPAIKYEELCPAYFKVMPSATLATARFHLEGVDGNANNWKDFGKWMYENLISNRMELSETTKVKVKNLVKGVEDPVEKAKIIYAFVQEKTRYISIQVGIGGWMPMLAEDVDRLSYGDCKALTNYTKSLMDIAGVESYYTAVYAGRTKRSMENEVVSVQGNHVFLYIPSEERDFWLECTSQTVPFGYQGTFTDDRDVLVITPEGGVIKHTGVYDDNDSFQKTVAQYKIDTIGNLKAEVKISSSGIQYQDHYGLEKKPERDIKKHYKSNYWSYINNLSIDDYSFKNKRDSIIFEEKINLGATDYATFSGNVMLFVINAFNKSSHIPERCRNRKLPFKISRGYIDKDEFEITLPKTYAVEAIPDDVIIENKYGKYEFSIEKVSPTNLKYSRTLFIKKGSYPDKEYNKYRNFRKQISKYDNAKIVLQKK